MTARPWLHAAGVVLLLTALAHSAGQLAPTDLPPAIDQLIQAARATPMELPGGVERTLPDLLEGMGWAYAASLALAGGLALRAAGVDLSGTRLQRDLSAFLLVFSALHGAISARWFFAVPLLASVIATLFLATATTLATRQSSPP